MSTSERGKYLDERLALRIAESPFTLTVHFPVVRAVQTGTSPGATPASPLTRPIPTTTTVSSGPTTPTRPDLVMSCLWYPAYEGSVGSARRNQWITDRVGWIAEADALARVRTVDAEVPEGTNYGQSVFSKCDTVEFQGVRYHVAGVHPVTAGWKHPTTLHVWLKGAVR